MMVIYFYFFNATVGLATLIGVCFLLLKVKSVDLYIALIVSALLSVGNLFAGIQISKAQKQNDLLMRHLIDELKEMHPESVDKVTNIAKNPGLRDPVVEIVTESLSLEQNAQVKCWLYVVLGCVGGDKAKRAIKKGLVDRDEYVRLCAEDALHLWEKHPKNEECSEKLANKFGKG